MIRWNLAVAFATGVVAVEAVGQSADERIVEEVTVTASPLGDVLQPASVLDNEALFRTKEATLGETLDGELGVSSSYFGPASSRPIIRGLGGSRVTMLSDTIASMDAADVSADHAVTIEPLLAESIEIIRGPATLLYGNNAAGGVVNVLDNRIPMVAANKPLSGAFELRGDTAAEERSIVMRLDGGLGGFAWHANVFDRETADLDIDGFATADPAERSGEEQAGTLLNSFSESDGYSAGLSWVGERGYVGVSYADLANAYGIPGSEEEGGESEGTQLFGGPSIDMEQNRVDIRGQFLPVSGWFESVSVAMGTNEYEHAEVEPSGEIGTLFENDARQLRLEAVHRPLGAWRGALGVQFDNRDLSAVGEEAFIGATETETSGFFLVEEREMGWGHIQVGGRVERLEHANVDFRDYRATSVSLAAGIEIELSNRNVVLANISRTERHPAPEELYANGPHLATRQFEIGLLATGSRVEKESSLNVEVGFARRTSAFNWSITGYVNDIGDFVHQNLTGAVDDGLPIAQYVQGDSRFIGVEAEVVIPIWAASGYAAELRWFGDYVEPELDSGDYLPRIPPLRTGLDLRVTNDLWQTSFRVVYHASQDNVSSFATESYTVVNLSGSYKLDWESADLELFARATNLLDEDARKSTSFLAAFAPLPGRSLHFGGRVLF